MEYTSNQEAVADMIFKLRKKEAEYLLTGDTDKFQAVRISIALLQKTHGIFSGKEKGK